MKKHIFAIILTIILFIVPFFWLKPGEMNLGGDSGRLFFYDPISYLNNTILYSFSSSGAGVESLGYPPLFFILVLALFKLVFSSTAVISIVNGIILSCAFLSVYFIARELLGEYKNSIKESVITCSSVLAGLLYIFSQLSIYSGWENPILSHNQIFLNPLIFLLILRHLITRKKLYMFAAIIVSVIFAANFSFEGAPPFFAFYPMSLFFLICYIKFIKKISISYKKLGYFIILFLCLHAFHLIPEIATLFSSDSTLNKTIFVQEGTLSRNGLSYFIAVASSVKLSLIWLSAAQFQNALIFSILIIFPTIFALGFYFNKGRTLLLTGVFFLIAMYLASANITDLGFFFYQKLFKIPGFSMFRNYYGQWLYVYLFFFALLFGQTFAIVAAKLSRRMFFILLIIFTSVILGFGLPLITGEASIVTHKEGGIRYAFRMDPVYENVLEYFKKYPIDGKIMSFPLTAPGFQIFQGKDGGVYQGLPTISYLTGIGNFSGYEMSRPFQKIFAQAMYDRNYDVIRKIFSALNIHNIFYNSDPYIYSNYFKAYLYNYISVYSPKDQNEYREFIENLLVDKGTDFGNNYHVYSLKQDVRLPHLFAATETRYTNNQISLTLDQNFGSDLRAAPLPTNEILNNKNHIFLYAQPDNPFEQLVDNSHLHWHNPYISHKLNDPLYALISVKEHLDLSRLRSNPVAYLDLSLLILQKRIFELEGSGEQTPVLKISWQEPKLWQFYNWASFNSWDATLVRYQKGVEELVDWVNNRKDSEIQKNENKIKISEQLFHHQVELLRLLASLNKKDNEKKYLYASVESIFDKLFQQDKLPIYDPSVYQYRLPMDSNFGNNFNIFLSKKNIGNNSLMNTYLEVNDQILKPDQVQSNDEFLEFTKYSNSTNGEKLITLHLPIDNLAKDSKWVNSEESGASIKEDKSTTTFIINNIQNNMNPKLLMPDWIPRSQYLITFEYMTSGDNFLFSFYDKKQAGSTSSYNLFFKKILDANTWKNHQSIVSAEDDSVGAFLHLTAFSANNKSKLQIRNLSIVKISYPDIIFKNSSADNVKQAVPKIVFNRINSTKYRINITGAENPYTLVFLESYSENWKLFNPEDNTESIRGYFSHFLGTMFEKIVGIFIKENVPTQSSTSYFNGDVKEGERSNIFLDRNTFETWGKEAVADDRHFSAFAYANAWIVRPENVSGKTNYTLILEFIPQKKFYPSLFLSLLTMFYLVIRNAIKLIVKK